MMPWSIRRRDVKVQLPLGWIGYRGVALLIFGIIYCCMGLAVTFNPGVDPNLWHTLLPVPLRVTIWSGAGIVALVAAFVPRLENIGFAVLLIGPLERFLSFTGAMFHEPNLARLTGVLVYFLLAALVALIASWPEPTPPPSQRLLRQRRSP